MVTNNLYIVTTLGENGGWDLVLGYALSLALGGSRRSLDCTCRAVSRVLGYVTTGDPGPNRVLFVLMLPDDFNGRYLYLGVGGAAGALPTIPQARRQVGLPGS
jgi:hypothetical protein